MSDSNSNKSVGIGFSGALLLIFITLKLCNVIAWSWWWVLSPVWIPLSITVLVLLVIAAIAYFPSKKRFVFKGKMEKSCVVKATRYNFATSEVIGNLYENPELVNKA